MFGNTFGRLFKITCCGESYAGGFRKNLPVPPELYGGLMVIVDGVPPGIKITGEMVQAELNKRKPGQTPLDSPRKEKDLVYIFSGVMENDLTTGAPVGMIIPNNDIQDVHIDQYRSYKDSIRPGHAEYGFFKKYGQYADWVGAGRASGRETASRVAGGAVAKAVLDQMGIDVIAYTIASHGIKIKEPVTYEFAKENYRKNEINCPDLALAEEMKKDILKVKADGETAGGIIECIASSPMRSAPSAQSRASNSARDSASPICSARNPTTKHMSTRQPAKSVSKPTMPAAFSAASRPGKTSASAAP